MSEYTNLDEILDRQIEMMEMLEQQEAELNRQHTIIAEQDLNLSEALALAEQWKNQADKLNSENEELLKLNEKLSQQNKELLELNK